MNAIIKYKKHHEISSHANHNKFPIRGTNAPAEKVAIINAL